MRCLANGFEGGTTTILKGADTTLQIVVMEDTGEDMSDGTLTAKFYEADNRSGTSFSISITSGELLIEADNSDINYNTTYYVYVELEVPGYGGTYVSQTPFAVQVK